MDCQLLFGLATAPAIFTALAEALEWILWSRGKKYIVHYLDGSLLLGHPNSEASVVALSTTPSTCRELCVPLAADKVEGPAPVLTFLSIELNTMAMSMALPRDKLAALCEILQRVQGAKCIRDLHQLQSLIGHLKPSVASALFGEGLPQQPLPTGESHEAGSSPPAQQCSTP